MISKSNGFLDIVKKKCARMFECVNKMSCWGVSTCLTFESVDFLLQLLYTPLGEFCPGLSLWKMGGEPSIINFHKSVILWYIQKSLYENLKHQLSYILKKSHTAKTETWKSVKGWTDSGTISVWHFSRKLKTKILEYFWVNFVRLIFGTSSLNTQKKEAFM